MDALNAIEIRREDVASADVAELLQRHFALMRSQSPEESCHVMAPDALAGTDVIVLGARAEGALLAVGALKLLTQEHGELKSMHTAQAARGRGVGSAILVALIAEARGSGVRTLSLETGTAPEFAAARALYLSHGFEECPPFGDYVADPLSVYMTRTI